MNTFKRKATVVVGALLLAPLAAVAEPAGTYDSIMSAVDFDGVSTGIVGIAALLAAVLVVKRGGRMILSMIGR